MDKISQPSKRRRLFTLILSCIILLGSFLAVYFTVIKPASISEAFSSNNTSSYQQVGELLLDSQSATSAKPFNKNKMNTLINMIYGSSGDMTTQVNSLKSQVSSTPITAKTLRAKTYNKTNGQSIVVRLGGLDWIVTYVSTDTSGNLIATLWLSNNHQEAWGWNGTGGENVSSTIGWNKDLGKYYAFLNGGLYSDWSADWSADTQGAKYPSNMYGTSYIRTETLNNPNNRSYAASDNATSLTSAVSQIKTLSGHPFALYTVSDFGLTNYITTPDQMKWMVNRQNPANRNDASYWLNNEALTSGNAYNYTASSGYYSGYNYESNDGYANWGKDYLWLPSMAETGYDDADDGFWETNTAERTTYDGYTRSLTNYSISAIGTSNLNGNSSIAFVHSWSRSAFNKNNAYDSYLLYSSGSVHNRNGVFFSQAVRPALLLTLNTAAQHSASPNITLDKQGGTDGTTSISVAEGNVLPTITPPNRTGFTFGGYYTSVNGGGTKIYNADGTPAISASTFTANTTLYAYWTWYEIASITGSTTQYSDYSSINAEGKFASLTITPTAGHIITQFSFDNTNWYTVAYIRYDISNTTIAVNVAYYANENLNSLVIEFKGIITNTNVKMYLKTVSGAYSGLKTMGGSVDGVAVQSTYGGVAMVVGANFAEMTDDDYVICSTMAIDNYAFMYWMDEYGNKLSYDESANFKKKDVYGSVLTAVFAPAGTDPNTYTVLDNSE